MQNLTQPTLLLKPFAESGDKNSIPVTNTDASNPQLADLTNGFPQVTSEDPDDGGLPPERKDINGLGYLTTTYDYFYQAGGTFTFNSTISTAIGGYPLGARLWYTDDNGVSCILRSTIANNTNNFLLDSTVIGEVGESKPWVVENFKGIRSQWSLFDTKWSDYELNDQSWLRSDTFSWQDGAVYTNAYNHLVDDIDGITVNTETIGSYTITYYQATDGHKIVLANQETAIQNIYNESGIAWYYVLDTTNQRFKLPRTKYGFTGYRDAVGKFVEAGLPNITGSFYALDQINDYSGAFFRGSEASGNYGGGGSYIYEQQKMDASRSSSIYGNDTTVQPPATQMYLYFYVGEFTQTATEQTAGLNASLFNNKLDLDLGNITNGAKEEITSLGIPDYLSYQAYTANDTFYADKDYYYRCNVVNGNYSGNVYSDSALQTSIYFWQFYISATANACQIPVCIIPKGTYYKSNASGSLYTFKGES